ncbi:NAD(P)-binding domain-containing protein [Streptomyces sp. NPDC004549]|uniref:NADPH-dependent F420 reductase n=1 Tax=Streptomyces sp. NPDC004549 TaxID=3154283 RepID=UPI0033B74813
MRYAVLGTGTAGLTIAARLDTLGHSVVVGTRSPRDTLARTQPDVIGNPPFAEWQAARSQVSLATFAEAAAFGEVVVNATAGPVSLVALAAAGAENLSGKILIDVSDPIDPSKGPVLNPGNTDSLGERIQRAFPDLKVVKALNTMNCRVMVDPARVPGPHNVFVCGDDADAKKTVAELLHSFGWPEDSVLDVGGIISARYTEMLAPMWLRLLGDIGHPDFNFHIQVA